MSNLIKHEPAYISLAEALNINPRKDELKLRIKGGVASAVVKRRDGTVQSITTMLGGRFKRRTEFDSSNLTQRERVKLVKQLRKEGLTQTAIAEYIGMSQGTVSQDLKK